MTNTVTGMNITDNDIIKTMREQPEKGFRLLMERYKEAVYWHIRRLLVSHADTQDATQETFVRMYRSFSQYRGSSSLGTWIYRIATNEALRILERRKGCQLSLDDQSASTTQIQASEYIDYDDLEAVRLQRAIHSLPAKQQLAFNLRYYDELPYDEIAEIAGSTAAAAKTNYHIAKEKIIQYMNSHD